MFELRKLRIMPTPREKRYDQTRQKILDASRKIIIAQGLDNFSMRVLAEQIDYSPSAIYKYFNSKEDILNAIREEFWQMTRQNQQNFDHLPVPERLLAAGMNYIEFAEAYPEHYLLVFNSSAEPLGGVEEMSHDARFSGLIHLVAEGVAQGCFRLPPGYTPESMAFHLWVSVHGMVMMRLTLMRAYRTEFDPLCTKIMSDFIKSFTVVS